MIFRLYVQQVFYFRAIDVCVYVSNSNNEANTALYSTALNGYLQTSIMILKNMESRLAR